MALDERYHREWSYISRYIRELFNYHCAKCGSDYRHQEGPDPWLQVHHIDENPQNNEITNLIPLCAPCHLRIEHEARLHAPYQEIQLEFFENHTYFTQMQKLRQEALERFGGNHSPSLISMTPEEYELQEREFELRDYDRR